MRFDAKRAAALAAVLSLSLSGALLAQQGAQAPQAAQQQQQAPVKLSGRVLVEKPVTVRGTDRKHKVVMVQQDQGRRTIVDLGPMENFQGRSLKDTRITVTGRPARVGDRMILVARTLTMDGETRQLRRQGPQQQARQDRQGQMAQQGAQRGQMAQQGRQTQRPMARGVATQLPVAAASALVGKPVLDNQGNRVGQLEYLMIDLQTGRVSLAVIGAGQGSQGGPQLVAVPWLALEASLNQAGEQQIRLRVPGNRLRRAPQIDQQQISRLTQPQEVTRLMEYYLVPEGQRWRGNQPRPQVLVGRRLVTLMDPPDFVSATDVAGTQVRSRDGRNIGYIDQIVIDLGHGQVAYVLIAHENIEGVGEEWTPVPFETLQWSRQQGTFRVDVAADRLKERVVLPRGSLPTRVRVKDLMSLYDYYEARPYWQEMGRLRGGG
ncbi:MAG: PRC-barrel domain-containing protein [Candidatus Competibacteraceae bacterium]|nr:PRC-barrel domain-containing protein [Candidatus Competibacteraceae bacterium]